MILDQFQLTGQTALVTGCRRGIGQALAVALAEAGADIIGVSASLQPGSEVEHAVLATGRRFTGYACDFGDRAALYRFLHQVTTAMPRIDILVNNAGTICRQPAVEHADDLWDKVLEINLSAQFILAREIGRSMLARRQGKIIFIASLLSFQGGITVPGYAASKHGVAALVKALANEWASQGVNVNGLAPGYIATDNTAGLRQNLTRNQQILERIPAGRWGTPSDLAGAVVFLSSRAADYLHGIILPVDGGWLAR